MIQSSVFHCLNWKIVLFSPSGLGRCFQDDEKLAVSKLPCLFELPGKVQKKPTVFTFYQHLVCARTAAQWWPRPEEALHPRTTRTLVCSVYPAAAASRSKPAALMQQLHEAPGNELRMRSEFTPGQCG
jgi:hypothetical protein